MHKINMKYLLLKNTENVHVGYFPSHVTDFGEFLYEYYKENSESFTKF